MKKRIILILLSFIMIVSLSAVFIACDEIIGTITYEISFDLNDGNAAEGKAEDFSVQTIDEGKYASPPQSEPTRTGYVFNGWYKNLAGEPFDFAKEKITSDITLIAGWVSDVPQLPIVTASFDLDGGSGAPANFVTQVFESGKKVKMPTSNPEKFGYIFKGWVDASGNEFDFDEEIITETALTITIKAKWNVLVTVQFNLDGGTGSAASQAFEPGGKPVRPTLDPTKDGCVFKGWVDAQGQAFDFDEAISATEPITVTVKAKWAVLVTVRFDLGDGEPIEGQEQDFAEQVFEAGGKATRPDSDPSLNDFTFEGYIDGNGDAFDFNASINPSEPVIITIYADWSAIFGLISFDASGGEGGQTGEVRAHYGEPLPAIEITPPLMSGWSFAGWFDSAEGEGTQYYSAQGEALEDMPMTDLSLFARWLRVTSNPEAIVIKADTHKNNTNGKLVDIFILGNGSGNYGYAVEAATPTRFTAEKKATTSGAEADATFVVWCVGDLTSEVISDLTITVTDIDYDVSFFVNVYVEIPASEPPACVADGTLITLADGSMVPVEELNGDELLLVWNMLTGQYEAAPILFIDTEATDTFKITHLYFSDGTEVKMIYEHYFWSFDQNEYVAFRSDAAQYIGQWFGRHAAAPDGSLTWDRVQLVDVQNYYEVTTAWAPVTFGYQGYYVNGMLSLPGGAQGFTNIFDVDPDTMQFDMDAYYADIEKYGLFSYEEFCEIAYIPEIVFEAFQGQYLKISIAKGLLSVEMLVELIEKYGKFW